MIARRGVPYWITALLCCSLTVWAGLARAAIPLTAPPTAPPTAPVTASASTTITTTTATAIPVSDSSTARASASASAVETTLANTNEQLLKDSRALHINAQGLLKQIYATEHSILYPHDDLVTVLFSQRIGARIFLHYAEFYINDKLIETYKYQMGKVELLAHYRAVQPMFTTLLSPGEYVVRVRIYGLAMGGDRFVEAEHVIQKGGKPLFLELNNSFREIAVSEWRQ